MKVAVISYLCLITKQQGLGRDPSWPHWWTQRMVSDGTFCPRLIIYVPYAISHCICKMIPFYLLDCCLHILLMHIYDAKSISAQISVFSCCIHQLAHGSGKVPADKCIGSLACRFALNCKGPKANQVVAGQRDSNICTDRHGENWGA